MSLSSKIIAYVLSVLMLLALLASASFFLGDLSLNLSNWLAFNACSLAIMIYLICFILFQISRKDIFAAVPILPLYYYGTMGLFMMKWNETNIFPQITHIIITLTVIWLLYYFLKNRKYESLGKGILISVILFVPVFAVIQSYNQAHIQEFMRILQGISN